MKKATKTVKMYGFLVGWIALCSLLYSCTPQLVQPPMPLGDEATPPDYLIGSEDAVEIQVWKNADLSRVVSVRPDGKISLPLIGDLQAAGLTAPQVAEAVTEKLKAYYKEPAQVTVLVNQVNSYAIFMLGEVRGQGKHIVRSGTSFLQALSIAGGFTQYAATNRILLHRKSDDGKEIIIPIRYKDVVLGIQANVPLRPGDTVVVP